MQLDGRKSEKKLPGLLKIIIDFIKNETGKNKRITSKRRAQKRQVLCEQQSHLTHFDDGCLVFSPAATITEAYLQLLKPGCFPP